MELPKNAFSVEKQITINLQEGMWISVSQERDMGFQWRTKVDGDLSALPEDAQAVIFDMIAVHAKNELFVDDDDYIQGLHRAIEGLL